MLKYLAVLFVLSLFVIGCTDESNMIAPANNAVNSEILINNQNQNNYPVVNPSFKEGNSGSTTVRQDSIIFQDSTRVPGTVSPNSRWGFIN